MFATLSTSLWRSALLGIALLVTWTFAAALALASWLPVSSWFVPKALLALVLWLSLSLPSLPLHGHPTLGPANALTLLRGSVVALLGAFVFEAVAVELVWALLFVSWAMFVLDWVDGRVARATGMASPFGARLDMELDAITIAIMCALVWGLGHAGPWVMLSGLLRYLFIAAGLLWPWMDRPLFPTPRRAWICGVQVVCLLGAILPWPVPLLTDAFAAFGLLALLWSFGVDTLWLYARRHTAPGARGPGA